MIEAFHGLEILEPSVGSDPPPGAGGKALGLLAIEAAGLRTAPWFLVRSGGALPDVASDEFGREVRAACRRIDSDPAARFAVRSSADVEDGAAQSYAGQFETALDVAVEDVPAAIARCFDAASRESVARYRSASGVDASEGRKGVPRLALIVQRFVDAEVAGIAFGHDPITGAPHAVIEAVRGSAADLLSGRVRGDLYRVARDGTVEALAADGTGVLSAERAHAVAEATVLLGHVRRTAQDVEWAYDLDGALVILQARPITALPRATEETGTRLWDNANIVESFPALTLPLTFSLIRPLYGDIYRNACRTFGVPDRVIEAEDALFGEMLGLLWGRVYYNLGSWFRIVALLPGFRLNAGFLEAMMGTSRPGSHSAERTRAPEHGLLRAGESSRAVVRLLLLLARFERDARRFRKATRRLIRDLDIAPGPRTPADPAALLDRLDLLRARAVEAWWPPIVNDLLLMIAHGALRRSASAWLGGDANDTVNALLSDAAVSSAKPATDLARLADEVREHPAWTRLLGDTPPADLARRLRTRDAEGAGFASAVDGYLSTWGDRIPRELQLEHVGYRDDLERFIELLRALVTTPSPMHPVSGAGKAEAAAAHTRVRALGWRRARILHVLMRATRRHIRWREEMRMARGEVFGVARRIVRALGATFERRGILAAEADVHYLTFDELREMARDTPSAARFRAVVAARRAQYAEYASLAPPPSRLETDGPIPALPPNAHPAAGDRGDTLLLRGIGAARGHVQAPCLVVEDPRAAVPQPGCIIVARSTDPGWMPFFVGAAGLAVQQGGLLSHSAIIARELAIPTVVGIPDLMARVREGDILDLDGTTGDVRIVTQVEHAT